MQQCRDGSVFGLSGVWIVLGSNILGCRGQTDHQDTRPFAIHLHFCRGVSNNVPHFTHLLVNWHGSTWLCPGEPEIFIKPRG